MLIMNGNRVVARSYPKGGPVQGFKAEPGTTCMDVPLELFRNRQEITYNEFHDWVTKRCFPRTRYDADRLLKGLGLSSYDPWAIVKITKARLPMDDEFWVNFDED